MATLYKKAKLLVSRSYYHGGDGLERGGLVFFRSMDEYTTLAKKHGWQSGPSFKTSWCVCPVELEVLVQPKHLIRFLCGDPLTREQVFFAGGQVDQVMKIGGWY